MLYNSGMKLFKRKAAVRSDGKNYLRTKLRIGLALSGGGARGFAHIGVIRAFEENNIGFDYVAGTSVGSIIGAMYAAGIDWRDMREFSLTVRNDDLIDKRILKIGSRSSNIEKVAEKLLNGKTFADLIVPFKAVAVDIVSGEEIVLDSGSVAKAVSASSAVPAVFKPVRYGDLILVDGGLLNNMPSDVVRQMGAEFVVGVDLNHTRGEGTASPKLWDTLVATWNITTKSTMYKGQMNSDVIIEPELRIFKNTSIDRVDEMIEEGYRAALQSMPEIKQAIGIK